MTYLMPTVVCKSCLTLARAVTLLDLSVDLTQVLCLVSLPTNQVLMSRLSLTGMLPHALFFFFFYSIKTAQIVVTVLRDEVIKSKLLCRKSTVTGYKANCRVQKLF